MNDRLNVRRRLPLTTAVSLAAVLVGLSLDAPYLWFPIAVLIAAGMSWIVTNKVTCDDLGRAQISSVFLNRLLFVTMLFANFGWIVCIALVMWWIV